MIVDKYIKKVIEDYIKVSYIHEEKVLKRLKKYLEFYEFLLIKDSIGKYSFDDKKKCNYLEEDIAKLKLKRGEFKISTLKDRKLFKGTISSKYITYHKVHRHIVTKDAKLFDVLKRDFLAMKILFKVRGKQPISNGYIGAVYSLNDLQNDITIENMWGDNLAKEISITIDHLHWRDDCFKVNNQELEFLLNGDSDLDKRIRNYSLMKKLSENGYVINRIENVTGRIHHNITQLSPEYRELIRTPEWGEMISYDLKSSHLYWLAILTKNEKLYGAIATGELKEKFNKKRLLTWLNSKNYNSSTYLKINEFMETNNVNHKKFRDENGILYYILGKLEADYVIGISTELKAKGVTNYSVHDQLYFDLDKEDVFFKLVEKWNKNLLFKPIWVKEK